MRKSKLTEVSFAPHRTAPFSQYFFYIYIILVFFLLINIVLAILIDAYAEVQQACEGALTAPHELALLVRMGIRRLNSMSDPSTYMSDDDLLHFALSNMDKEHGAVGKAENKETAKGRTEKESEPWIE